QQYAEETEQRGRHVGGQEGRRRAENDARRKEQREENRDDEITRLAATEREVELAGRCIAHEDETVPGDGDDRPEEKRSQVDDHGEGAVLLDIDEDASDGEREIKSAWKPDKTHHFAEMVP